MRQLAEWGPLAFAELRRAASGGDLEAAILARDLLAELEETVLIGAHVRLEVNRARVAWDEPVTLTIHAHNPTAGPVRVPWPKPANTAATTQATHDDAAQVGAMMDAGDFLTVTGPDGRPIDLRIEPIDRARAVYEAVNLRAWHAPPSHLVEPGATGRLRIPLFNRGWARYPMLSAGRYTIAFSCQPEWKDASWTEDGLGLVRAAPVTVEVHQDAPEVLRRSDKPLAIHLGRTGETLVVQVQSTWDFPQWINLNLGNEITTHGRLGWQLLPSGDDGGEPVWLRPGGALPPVRLDLIRRLEPGATLTLDRVPAATIRQRARQAGLDKPGTFELSACYAHIAKPARIREQLEARDEKGDVPGHLFSGTVTSEPIEFQLRQ